ncbi:uncharacterized protein (TIGR00288 family) [Clostridiales Family XIII bacterium PM5-7]
MDREKEKELRYAVLIDADNVPEKYIKIVLNELAKYGIATYKRIYGDWTSSNNSKWKKSLLENSIIPVQQYSYTTGKNSTDSAMIIDAMDILYSHNVDGFCLVTSDSDFTRLAARLRESGMDVIGMGEKKTPRAFISACNLFKYVDVLAQAEKMEATQKPDTKVTVDTATEDVANRKDIIKVIASLIIENSDEDGWLFTGELGNALLKRQPDFDVRNYGFQKLTPFIKSLEPFETKAKVIHGTSNKLVYVRMKAKA